ncbi:MAG: serine/threonine-protein kinase, partial [Phycisphaerales bacterium]|nr:serine/threonine-protein kinase [Phycisphaerales bacterium]
MVDDATTHHDDSTEGEFDPNGATFDGETASKGWLDSNVSPRIDEWVGKTIGQFEIIQIIGTGGMGNVYEARQLQPHRSVALKIVKSAAASPVTLHRFEMESEMLARLQHPGIAQVYDSGHQMQGETLLPFFAMEYVPGSRSITDYAQNEHLSREGRLELFLLVCNAVQYGHGRGIIHRDLKPSNILINSAGRPKVIDFGIALIAGSDEVENTVTLTGRFIGTLQWASPEQCGDDPHD